MINWQIPIGLLFYKSNDLKADGYLSYIDLINKAGTPNKVFWQPFGLALAYTFGYPIIKNVIQAVHAWAKTWGTNLNLRITKTGKVSVSKYIQLRDNYIERTHLLEQVLEKESEYLKENESLKTTHLELTHTANENQSWINRWRRLNNIGLMNGQWSVTMQNEENKFTLSYVIFIDGGAISQLDESTKQTEYVSSIENFHCNPDTQEIIFVLMSAGKRHLSGVHTLTIVEEGKYLRGFADKTNPIEYKRVNIETRYL
ncbi:hypothetical protein SY85_11830 [Flavisolibacter tropicus]|uniref:Uncharacterized protein n=1 Tax=Flavisolibacter tropicus TaxID=1492898 RepID=A0A172TVT8_9BACT|nr:hypothetical protein SY85_11830 [Flavisolibacter tropicus]